jgi:nucleotide-binding universal stress UspA family protein
MVELTIPDIKKILYTTDLSANARHAFVYAASIAHRYGAGITILHVLEAPPLSVYFLGEQWEEIKEKNVKRAITEVNTRLDKFRANMSTELASHPFTVDDIRVKVGIPEEEILQEVEKGDFDVLVMGTHGHGAFADAMMGSTARRVLRRSKKPVLVVRLPEGDD